MKLNKINTIFITTLFTIQSYGSDYDNASFENYVTGQGVNEVILEAQEIICSLAKLRTEDLAGDGSYIATIFSDECVQTSLSNSTLSPNVLLVNVCVAAIPANVSATAGITKAILPEKAECGGAFSAA